MSIPLRKGKNQQKPIGEIEVSYDMPWVSNHINTITSAYGNAPYFLHYADPLFAVLRQKHRYLLELNTTLLNTLLKMLGLAKSIRFSVDYLVNHPEVNDLRNRYGIKGWSIKGSPSYVQVFQEKHGFIPNLSILDVLFCLGPESTIWLQKLLDWQDECIYR